jgi:hypothetical protein
MSMEPRVVREKASLRFRHEGTQETAATLRVFNAGTSHAAEESLKG